MDNEELKKSLACCAHEGYSCDECLYQKKGHDCEEVSKDALELINNLEAEIEKMKNEVIEGGRKTAREIVVEMIKKGFELSVHPEIFSFRVVDIEDVLKIAKKYGVEEKK